MKNSNRDFSLDLLRALACIMVLGVHFVQHFPIPGAIGAFFEKGSTGVGFFFILSGYLAYCSLEKEFSRNSKFSDVLITFYIKRAVHVLPLYYFVILVYFVIFSYLGTIPVDNSRLYWIRYIFLINRWIPSTDEFWINLGATWSISVFVLFYLLVPFIYCVVKNSLVAAICVALSYGALKFSGTNPIPIMYMFFFFLGILVYLSEKERTIAWIISAECLLFLFCVLTNNGSALLAPVIASLYLLVTREIKLVPRKESIVNTAVTFISTVSYSIYLGHAMVFTIMDAVGIKIGLVYLLVFIISTVVVTILFYFIIEKRFKELLML